MRARAAACVLNAVVLLLFVFPRNALADSQSFQGTVQPGQSVNFTVTTDALGPLNYTLTWSNGAPLESCIYAPGSGDPDACGSSPSPQPVADSPTVKGTFTVCVFLAMGYPQTDFTLVVNYPTMTTDAFVGNEVRDDPTIPPNKWKFAPTDAPAPAFQVRGWQPGLLGLFARWRPDIRDHCCHLRGQRRAE